MLWNSHVSHEEKVQIIADLARIICYAERPTVNPGPLEAFTLEEIPDLGYYADEILTIRIDPFTTMIQDEDRGGVGRQVDAHGSGISKCSSENWPKCSEMSLHYRDVST
jgi:hypothetical protein